ncbi:MAG TPA: chromate transporter [Bryobacteraceae bacterium]|nr:chromate transporter [Bryobacteraceae bacterium]
MSDRSLGKLTNIFLRVGNTTFGGGYVTMAVLGRELVDLRRWITSEDYALAFALARVTPGTNVIAFCAAAGWLVMGAGGAVAAVLASCAPSAALAVLILQGIESGSSHRWVMGALAGTVAAVSGTMWSIVAWLVRPFVKGGATKLLRGITITGGAFLASWKFNITPVPILAAAAMVSLIWRDAPARAVAANEGGAK